MYRQIHLKSKLRGLIRYDSPSLLLLTIFSSIVLSLSIHVLLCWPESFVVRGEAEARIAVNDYHGITISPEDIILLSVTMKVYLYHDYHSVFEDQGVEALKYKPVPDWGRIDTTSDHLGNLWVTAKWEQEVGPNKIIPLTPRDYGIAVTGTIVRTTRFIDITDATHLPLHRDSLPKDIQCFLDAATFTKWNDPIVTSLVDSLKAEGSCVDSMAYCAAAWCSDNLKHGKFHDIPDAMRILKAVRADSTRRVGCSGGAHVLISLLRAAGIPARYVGGRLVTGVHQLHIRGGGTFEVVNKEESKKYAHAWVEVYYPTVGWVPFDYQNTLRCIDPFRYRGIISMDLAGRHPGHAEVEFDVSGPQSKTIWVCKYNSRIVEDDSDLILLDKNPFPKKNVLTVPVGHNRITKRQ